MPVHDFNAERLFIDANLAAGASYACSSDQANYLVNVLRLKAGEQILVFNGRDGEWAAKLADVGKRRCTLEMQTQTRPQEQGPDLVYLFAPLKRARLDYMVQKAVEMGVSALQPVLTRRTQASRVNLERMRANAIEAAEQCGILHLPEIREPLPLDRLIDGWDEKRRIVFCDETAAGEKDPLALLEKVEKCPLAVLIGPEGGFDPQERKSLLAKPFTVPIPLGPRIMRADTAAVAALALVNAVLGDWKDAS